MDAKETLTVRDLLEFAPPLPVRENPGAMALTVPSDGDQPAVHLDFSTDGRFATATAMWSIDAELAQKFREHKGTCLSKPLRTAFETRKRVLPKAGQLFVSLFAQTWGSFQEHVVCIRTDNAAWRIGDAPWVKEPTHPTGFDVKIGPTGGQLSTATVAGIQGMMVKGERPFLAFEFHREATRVADNRFAWLLAAAAAELGVKEALIRLEPKLDPVLLELPSPPSDKIWGKILKEYGGDAPSRALRDRLAAGASRRNKVIHRPDQPSISSSDRNKYLQDVRQGLEFLVALCRKRGCA